MKKQILIALGREYGSGGHCIAEAIATNLGIELLDRKIVESTQKISGYREEIISQMDEKPVDHLNFRRIGEFSNSIEEHVAYKTFELFRNLADNGESFVVVGRCAEYILRGRPGLLSIFVSADNEDKILRIMERKNLTREKAVNALKIVDHRRRSYHNYYCDKKWGDSRNYDITINSSRLGIDKTAEALTQYIRLFQDI